MHIYKIKNKINIFKAEAPLTYDCRFLSRVEGKMSRVQVILKKLILLIFLTFLILNKYILLSLRGFSLSSALSRLACNDCIACVVTVF